MKTFVNAVILASGEKKISTYWWLVSCGSCPLGRWRFVSSCRGWPTFQKWLWNLACLRDTPFLARATGWLIWLGYSWLLLRYQESSRAGYWTQFPVNKSISWFLHFLPVASVRLHDFWLRKSWVISKLFSSPGSTWDPHNFTRPWESPYTLKPSHLLQ